MSFDYSQNDLENSLLSIGVKKGDTIFVHSQLSSLGKINLNPSSNFQQSLLNSFIKILGSQGTIVVPTFTFDFCKGIPFDIQHSPSIGMGSFSEFVRLHPDSNRSSHPIHSVAAIGQNSSVITTCEGDTEFSINSAFDMLVRLEAKVIFLGVEFVETFFHMAEERAQVPYRHWKKFTGKRINNSEVEDIAISYYARNITSLSEPIIDIKKIYNFFNEKKLLNSEKLGKGLISQMEIKTYVLTAINELEKDPTFGLIYQSSAKD